MNDYFAARIGTHIWFPLAVIAVLEAMAVYSWQFRKEPGARMLAYIQIGKATWLLALVMAASATDPQTGLIWMNIHAMTSLTVCIFSFRFFAGISNFNREATRRISTAMTLVVALTWVVIWTNRWHSGIWRHARPDGQGPVLGTGPMVPFEVLAAFAMGIITTAVCVHWLIRCRGMERRQAQLVLLSSLVSWCGVTLVHVPSAHVLAPLPTFFVTSSGIVTWTYFRWRMYGILPLAQEFVVKDMIDGLMVVDVSDRIFELNPTAQAILAGLPVEKGTMYQTAAEAWPALAGLDRDTRHAVLEMTRKVNGTSSTYRVTQTGLRTSAGYLLGRVLVFKDITQEKRQQARILDQQKAISILSERQRLGRELHDGQGQMWSFVSMQAQAVRRSIVNQEFGVAERRLDRLMEVAQGVHTDIREAISGLQTEITDHKSLLSALEDQLRWYREQCDLDAQLLVRCDWRQGMIAPHVEAQLLRIIQEALTNVRKYSGASQVEVAMERKDGTLAICVRDNGCGFDLASLEARVGHHGLNIMRERAKEIETGFEIDSQPGAGTCVCLRVPIVSEALSQAAGLS